MHATGITFIRMFDCRFVTLVFIIKLLLNSNACVIVLKNIDVYTYEDLI